MQPPDRLSARLSDLLEGSYDCPDRIVLNAFYPLGFSPGGFRDFWRKLHGDDDKLDNNHLMRMAGRFSRRLRAWAKANSVPIVYCGQGERKHLLAEPHVPQDPCYSGVFVIIVGRAPAPLWHVQRSEQGRIVNIKRSNTRTFVNPRLLPMTSPSSAQSASSPNSSSPSAITLLPMAFRLLLHSSSSPTRSSDRSSLVPENPAPDDPEKQKTRSKSTTAHSTPKCGSSSVPWGSLPDCPKTFLLASGGKRP